MRSPSLKALGTGLNRPECILSHSSGLLFVPNWTGNGGISIINGRGDSTHLLCTDSQKPIKPNGIALDAHGQLLLAHLGADTGGVFELNPDGGLRPIVTHADGHPLPPTNFVVTDAHDRIWITVSTTRKPRALDYRANACTGFIALAQPGETNARIVAKSLGYTNECVVDLEQSAVYVNETFARRLSRFDLADDGSLSNKTCIAQFAHGTYPDGLTVDEHGDFWITSIVSNRVIKVSVNGKQTLILDDCDNDYVNQCELAYQADQLEAIHLGQTGDTTLRNISSLAFGGSTGKTVYLGNLLGDCVHQFTADVKGRRPQHWDSPLDDRLSQLI